MNPATLVRRFPLLYGLLVPLTLAILSLAGCGNQPGTAEGIVRAEGSQETIAQAKVVVFALETLDSAGSVDIYGKKAIHQEQLTDANGKFSFSLEPGSYVMQVWVEGLEVGDRMVQVKPGRVTAVDFTVEIPPP